MVELNVTSEVGALRDVIVHTPGPELISVTPRTREDYLYDDIIDLAAARREHAVMVSALRRFANVFEVRDLLMDVIDRPEVREMLLERAMQLIPSDALPARLRDTPREDLVDVLIRGETEPVGPIARALNARSGALPPLPNLFFTRDVGVVVGKHLLIGAMRYEVRWSEEMLFKALFGSHPLLQGHPLLYDGSHEQRIDFSLEGGDIHCAREDLLIVGMSDRSSASALDGLCDLAFRQGTITDVIVVVMPGEPTAIHLDMLFTQIDRDLCVVSPRHFIGPERLAVLHRRKGQDSVREREDLFTALREVDLPLEPVRCGGARRRYQEREQWASGCNLLAVRPGVALAYERNDATLKEFEDGGFRILDAGTLTDQDIEDSHRKIITFRGSELVRGGGGPRCMTLPLRRDDL